MNQGHAAPGPLAVNQLKQALAEIEKKLGICAPCIILSIFFTLLFWALLIFVAPGMKSRILLAGLWFLTFSFSTLSFAHLSRFLYLSRHKSKEASSGENGLEQAEEQKKNTDIGFNEVRSKIEKQ